MKYSVVIPVYKNQDSIPRLILVLSDLNKRLSDQLEVIFVVDGSPDLSFQILRKGLSKMDFKVKLLVHSRNFGSFPAIRSGLAVAQGNYFGVMAADLQEPPELLIDFFNALEGGNCDVTIGTRTSRNDPFKTRLTSGLFWAIYRRLVVKEMPEGGVDVFGCNRQFRDHLLQLGESRSSLIALIFWLGFERKFINYERLARQEGASSWTFSKKIEYMMDSIFAFTDYPIRLLIRIGMLGCVLSCIIGLIVMIGHFMGRINVPGYAATMLVVLFFGALNLLGIGLVGIYAWRSYENSKQRPLAIVSRSFENRGANSE
jgi:polyisoprenyl-phosphate glycosyltransferase